MRIDLTISNYRCFSKDNRRRRRPIQTRVLSEVFDLVEAIRQMLAVDLGHEA